MTNRRTLQHLTTASVTDTSVIATLIEPAITRMEESLGGFPTHTPGAAPADPGPLQECAANDCTESRPCPRHEADPIELTPVERLAEQHDPAAHDLTRTNALVRKKALIDAELAALCTKWGLTGLNATDVKERLLEIDGNLWCKHCTRLNQKRERAPGEQFCRLCADYLRKYHDYPTLAIFDAIKSRGGKLYVQDIARIRLREGSDRKRQKKSA